MVSPFCYASSLCTHTFIGLHRELTPSSVPELKFERWLVSKLQTVNATARSWASSFLVPNFFHFPCLAGKTKQAGVQPYSHTSRPLQNTENRITENTNKFRNTFFPPSMGSTGLLIYKQHCFNNLKETASAPGEISFTAKERWQQLSCTPLSWQGQAALGQLQKTTFKTCLESRKCCWTLLL